MHICQEDANNITFELDENLTFDDHRSFRELIANALNNKKGVVFNCQKLMYIDSAGLGMLLLAKHETEKFGKTAAIHGAQGTALELLKTVAFDQHFYMHDTVQRDG